MANRRRARRPAFQPHNRGEVSPISGAASTPLDEGLRTGEIAPFFTAIMGGKAGPVLCPCAVRDFRTTLGE